MTRSTCRPETILSSETCDVQFCDDCQLLHINMGAITIRMNQQHFADFAIDISKAMFAMRQREVGDSPMRRMM